MAVSSHRLARLCCAKMSAPQAPKVIHQVASEK
jgi:hypothetical protein